MGAAKRLKTGILSDEATAKAALGHVERRGGTTMSGGLSFESTESQIMVKGKSTPIQVFVPKLRKRTVDSDLQGMVTSEVIHSPNNNNMNIETTNPLLIITSLHILLLFPIETFGRTTEGNPRLYTTAEPITV